MRFLKAVYCSISGVFASVVEDDTISALEDGEDNGFGVITLIAVCSYCPVSLGCVLISDFCSKIFSIENDDLFVDFVLLLSI